MKVRKAIIPAAGLGTRFLPATKAQPKEMLPIVDKPTIQYIVEEAVESGIEEILIISGRSKRAIEDHFDRSIELEQELMSNHKNELLKIVKEVSGLANIHYIRQKEPRGLGHAIGCGECFIGNEPFAVLLGDDIVDNPVPCLKQMMDCYDEYKVSILGVQEVEHENISKYGIIDARKLGDKVYKVDDLVEKPNVEDAPSNIAILGRYIISPRIFDILKQTKPGKGGEIQLTDALKLLMNYEAMYAYNFDGRRYDVGDKIGFLRANIEFALERPDLREEFKDYLKELYVREKFNSGELDLLLDPKKFN